MLRRTTLSLLALCASCGPPLTSPRLQLFEGLPISGSLGDAQRAGFSDCFNTTAIEMRCRRHNVMLAGQGPFEAAVDLTGGDGSGGFDQLILWDEGDQDGVFPFTDLLERQGWRQCMTGTAERGDQLIYTRSGSRTWIAMDLSYWSKRRLRLIPDWNRRELKCAPGDVNFSHGFK